MGISGLLPLLKSIHKPCNLKKFSGQTIGVDAYGWLHRGTVSCAIDLALDKPTMKYVDFAMSRVRMLVHFGITPYIVFDGDYLPSKACTEKERAARRKESKRVGLELLKLGKTSQAHLELQKAVDVTPEMARLFIEELKRNKIQYVVAPYEADSQLAYLERKGIIHGILSEDSDLLVFGAKCLITKLDQYGDCVMICRNEFTACREISLVGWTDADFRRMAILSGCDYLPSINKMGLKTAYRLLRKHKTVERLIRAIQFDGQFKVPPGYLDSFIQAEMTFLYQWVFCPLSNQVVNFTDPEPGINPRELPYIGHHVPADVALGVSLGDLNPHTKEPIVVETRRGASSRPLIPSKSRQDSVQTPDEKKTKSIDSFFKPKRTPLAELDPNSFTPSPSQQRLLDQNPRPWSAASVPSQTQANRRPSLPFTAPQPARRAISDSWTGGASAPYSSKRQRLCSDTSILTPEEGSVKVESGRSRFFAPSPAEFSPSVRTTHTAKKASKAEINLWSDDSIEEAMAELPDFDDFPPKPKKVAIFTDSQSSGAGTSQYTTASIVESQDICRILTPATSFGSLSASKEEETPFSAHLSEEVKALRTRFSYQQSTTETGKRNSPTAKSTFSGKRRVHASPSATSNSALRPTTASGSSQKVMRSPISKKEIANTNSNSIAETTNGILLKYQYREPVRSKDDLIEEESVFPELEDSAWSAMESEIVVPASETCNSEDLAAPKPVLARDRYTLKGSEDMFIPDSEEEQSDGSDGCQGFDLERFVFVPK
ncbi:exonuclease-like protein [Lepidopterella palustris CBS 459.81]|uniref:Exonuclease-like protein n=1 Tax=Lepidopterella palustris CBS 459.81 TaxID=1314670 RepID=A0A8E2JEA9_9PEZI|nr:exonuclease-like protein [Lepidopterella palustris CBS 459.81]